MQQQHLKRLLLQVVAFFRTSCSQTIQQQENYQSFNHIFINSKKGCWRYYNELNMTSSSYNKRRDSNKLEKKQQIPTEYNEEQTLRVIRKQTQIKGEARSKTINDFPYAAEIAQVLKGLEFPTDKKKIMEFLQQQQSKNAQSREVLSVLQQIEEEKQYNNVADITKAAGLVEES
jgi:Protein of unknown function (DUF2795)